MLSTQELLSYLDIPFSFQERPTPLQAQSRVIWGLSMVTLILHICCRGKRSSITRLHLLNWSVRSAKNKKLLLEFLENRNSPMSVLIRYEPSFNRAVEYALADGLVEMTGKKGSIKLTTKGQQLSHEILTDDTILKEEKEFLRSVGPAVTEELAKSLVRL